MSVSVTDALVPRLRSLHRAARTAIGSTLMSNGFDDLARIALNPFNRCRQHVRRVLNGRMRTESIDALLDELDNCWEQNKTTVQLIGEVLVKVFPLIDAHSARSKAVLQSLRTIASRFPQVRPEGYDFSGIWPLEMAAFAVDAQLHPHFELFPDGTSGSPIDLFLEPQPGKVLHPGYFPISLRTTASGLLVPGIAVECKAVESPRKLCKNFRKALQQIEPFGSGLVAFDVSSILVDELSKGSRVGHDALVAQCSEFHAQLHARTAEQTPLLEKESPWIRQRLAGFLVHAHVFSNSRATLGNEPSRQLTVYRRVIWSRNPNFNPANNGISTYSPESFDSFLEHMFRNCRCWEHVDRGEGQAYVLRDDGESMFMGFGPDFRGLVRRTPKKPDGEKEASSMGPPT